MDREPRYLAIAREVEAGLRGDGRGDGRIPSARQIAGRHGVSIVTASRAVQVLRDKGLIRTVERSGSFLQSRPAPDASKERWAICFRSTPGPWQPVSMWATRQGFEALAREQGTSIDPEALGHHLPSRATDLKRAVGRLLDADVSGLFFMPSRHSVEAAREDERLLVACREAGLAVVLIERNLRGHDRPLDFDLIAADDLDGGLSSTRHLLDQGRRRVAYITGSPTSSHDARLAGYLLALQLHDPSGSGPRPIVLEQEHAKPSKAAYQRLADDILRHRCDGVVCYQDYTAVGLIMELLSRGRKVPAEVAITGFDNLPIGSTFSLGVTTYAAPGRAIAIHAFRTMRWRRSEPSAPPIRVLVPGGLIVRESSDAGVAPPPESPR